MCIHVQDCVSAKDVWTKLCNTFEDSGLCRRVSLLRTLITTRLEDCGSMEEYVNLIMSTAQKLNGIKFVVQDEWIGTLLLAGLPEHYGPMIMGIESSGAAITGDSIKSRLLQEMKNTNPSMNSAFLGTSNSNHKSHNGKGIRCYECNSYGHKASACVNRKPKKNNQSKGDVKPQTKVNNKERKAFCTVFSAGSVDKDDWYVDSGAGKHLTMRDDWMTSKQPSKIKEIVVANNSKLPVDTEGEVCVNVKCEGSVDTVPITNVQFVPDLSANLLSVSQLAKRGYTSIFDSKGCRIINESGELCATASLVNDIYKLDLAENRCLMTSSKCDNDLWHRRMGHLHQKSLLKLSSGLATGINFKAQKDIEPCISCLKGKQTRIPFPKFGTRATSMLELIHSDLCGDMECSSISGARYFLTFIDDFSRKVFVYFLKSKSMVKEIFSEFKAMVENQTGIKIKIIRTDNGLEYCNNELEAHLKRAGIRHQTSNTYTPQQNGLAERMNRTLVEKAKSMIFDADLPKSFWAEAVATAAYIVNRSPTKGLTAMTPEEVWTGKIPDLSHMRIFGCKAMVHVPKQKRKKWDAKSEEKIFVGYSMDTKGYRLVDLKTKKLVISRDVVFLENSFIPKDPGNQVSIPDKKVILDLNSHNDCQVSVTENGTGSTENLVDTVVGEDALSDSDDDIFYSNDDDSEAEASLSNETPIVPDQILRRSERKPKPIDRLVVGNFVTEPSSMEDPVSVDEAMKRSDSDLWSQAMEDEFKSLQQNDTWDLVDLPANRKAIDVKWVFKTKKDIHGNIVRYKARLVAKGFTQRKGIDYCETYSPVVRQSSIRYLVALAAQYDLEIDQMDAISAFLQGEIKEELYIVQPKEFRIGDKVCKLKKAIYGLKQASREWNLKLDAAIKSIGFRQSEIDLCVYYLIKGKLMTFIAVHVDDLMIFSNDKEVRSHLKNQLSAQFKMTDLGTATYCVGFHVTRDREAGKIYLDQEKHIRELLIKFNMNDCKTATTPGDPNQRLTKDMSPKTSEELEEMFNVPYQNAVGGLLYIAQGTRPDIAYAVNSVSRFNNNPGKAHWTAVKRILRYLKGTMSAKIEYSKTVSSELMGYCDADWAGDPDDRRSTTGYCFLKQGGAVSWCSTRQKTIALSSTEAEYMSLSSATQEALWLRQFQNSLKIDGHSSDEPMKIHCDNMSAIDLAKTTGYHARSKHIDIRHHFVRQRITEGQVNIEHIGTEYMTADVLTKALVKQKHMNCATGMGMKF